MSWPRDREALDERDEQKTATAINVTTRTAANT